MRLMYGAITLYGGTFQNPSTTQQLCNSVESLVTLLSGPTTPYRQRHQALTPARFRLFPFRSPLLRESLLLFFPQGTEMFQFPWFPLPALYIQTGVPPFFAAVGFPIRTSTDQCLVGSSPWLFAATHVLHRLQAPRHPPLALCSLENKMLVLAMQFSRNARSPIEHLVRVSSGGWCLESRPRAGRHAPSTGPRSVSPENGTEVARLARRPGLEVQAPTTS